MPRITASKYTVFAGWDDVPHLDDNTKQELLRSTPPHLRDARSKGLPTVGSGLIYPVPLDDILCDPFQIPASWPRAYALDVGWKVTASLWGALDDSSGITYVYTEHYRGEAEPTTHAAAIKARGDWIPGVIDPASRGRSQKDGTRLIEIYRSLGLELTPAINEVSAGLQECWMGLSSGRIKVFRTCQNFQAEIRLYRRNARGMIVKERDHLMDCLRYLVMSGMGIARTKPLPQSNVIEAFVPGDARVAF